MSRRIKITFKDGTAKEFKHKGREGGSYTIELHLENGFAIVENEWGDQEIFPESTIAKIEKEPLYR